MEAKLIKMMEGYIVSLTGDIDDIYAITNKELAEEHGFYSLSLKNCQAIELGYDLDELAKTLVEEEIHDGSSAIGLRPLLEEFVQLGFQKALSILGDKKFTYNQMVSAITESSISHRLPSLIIQDLQQTEWDVIIKMRPASLVYKSNLVIEELDADGCIILKRK
jgi:hypothetical protein